MDHHFRCGAGGTMEGYEDKYYFGRRPNGPYIPRYRNLFGDKRDYIRGFGYQGGASRSGWAREIAELNIEGNLKMHFQNPGHGLLVLLHSEKCCLIMRIKSHSIIIKKINGDCQFLQ